MEATSRPDGRVLDELRPVSVARGYTQHADGSVLIEFGATVVLCTATIEDRVPAWRRESGAGWVTAEYSMLPGSTPERVNRERRGAGGRTKEIERLIGRSLRAVVDMKALASHQIIVDCDVLQADGGTRTAAITGGWIALHDACVKLLDLGRVTANPILQQCAAVSVGIVDGQVVLDLPYVEDVKAEVDMNVVMTDDGRFIEVQGTGENATFDRSELVLMLDLAERGIKELFAHQQTALNEFLG